MIDHCSYAHNLSSCEIKAWKKFRPQRDSNPWPLRYRCSALPTVLSSHLGAGQYVSSSRKWWRIQMNIRKIIYLNCGERYENMIVFFMWSNAVFRVWYITYQLCFSSFGKFRFLKIWLLFFLEDCYRRTVRLDGEEVTIDILDTACKVSHSFSFSVTNSSELS